MKDINCETIETINKLENLCGKNITDKLNTIYDIHLRHYIYQHALATLICECCNEIEEDLPEALLLEKVYCCIKRKVASPSLFIKPLIIDQEKLITTLDLLIKDYDCNA